MLIRFAFNYEDTFNYFEQQYTYDDAPSTSQQNSENANISKFTCGVCYSDNFTSKDSLYGMDCGHLFCINCYRNHVLNAVQVGKISTKCPAEGCDLVLDQSTFAQLLDPANYLLSEKLRVNLMVDSPNNCFVPCLRVGCDKVFYA